MDPNVHTPKSTAGTLETMSSSGWGNSSFLQEFSTLLDSGASLALDEAFLVASSALQGGIDTIEYLSRIDDLASEVPSPTAEGIARHLFAGSDGFRGNTDSYYDPANSLLDRVLQTRRGIPISLSVLMIGVARRLGVTLVGVGMPSHFLVGLDSRPGQVPERFVDPFHSGEILDRNRCRDLFHQLNGGGQPFDVRFLAAVHPFAVLDRFLGNLKFIYTSSGEMTRLRTVMALRHRLPGLQDVEKDEFFRLMAPLN